MPRAVVDALYANMSLPVICSPMFIVSQPELVIAQCLAGVVGSMPALNARPPGMLDQWLTQIRTTLDAERARQPHARIAPYAINQIVHASNDRLAEDMAVCERHAVPLIITSLRAPDEVVASVHGWGGKVLHDVTTLRHAEKALAAGVDGLILVAAGAGGHAGTLSPFALLAEIRRIYDGPVVLSGAISTGADVLAARAMGADFAYMGTRFIASTEAHAAQQYKEMLVSSSAADILCTPYFTGIPGNYLRPSIVASGLDPDHLPAPQTPAATFGSDRVKPWRDVWGAGQGVGSIDRIQPVADIVADLRADYHRAKTVLSQEPF